MWLETPGGRKGWVTEGSRTNCPPSLLTLRGMNEGLWGLHPKVEEATNKNREDLLTSSIQGEIWEESKGERGSPGNTSGEEPTCQGRSGDLGSIPGLVGSPGGGHTPVFLPGESHQQRSLVGYSPWDRKELDTTEQLSTHKIEEETGHHVMPACLLLWKALTDTKWSMSL